MLKDLPLTLVQASEHVLEAQPDGLIEDALTLQNSPNDDEPEAELSGEKEEVIINPEYKTFLSRHRQ
jgi:hypothetical protein